MSAVTVTRERSLSESSCSRLQTSPNSTSSFSSANLGANSPRASRPAVCFTAMSNTSCSSEEVTLTAASSCVSISPNAAQAHLRLALKNLAILSKGMMSVPSYKSVCTAPGMSSSSLFSPRRRLKASRLK